jgi:hypothetical protein
MYKHPGPLEDVSKLSLSRKLLVVALVAIFAVCGITVSTPVYTLRIESVSFTGKSIEGVPFRIYYVEIETIFYSNQTPWPSTSKYLAAGTYKISFNSTFTKDGITYRFVKWEDGDCNLNKTINLRSDIILRTIYEVS